MQYFSSRSEAGKLLAAKLENHSKENTAIIALSEGAVLVAAEIAKHLHSALYLLATEDITLPRESSPVATMSSAGTFTYNSQMSVGQLEEETTEYRSLIDQEKYEAFQHLNRLVGKDGAIKKTLLKRHTVILVSDGFNNALSLDVAADFVKPIDVARIIVAVPIATVPAVDRMHLLADEIFCLGIVDNYLNTNHYYENNDIPDHKTVVEIMQKIVLSWENIDPKTAANN
jgi:putative phosphoribosyl transferase